MKITQNHILWGAVAAALGVYYYHTRVEKQKKAGVILDELQKVLHPETKGVNALIGLDPKYVDQVLQEQSGVIVLHPKTVARYAKRLHKAFHPWHYLGDDEQEIYTVLKLLKDHLQVSQVAKDYQGYDSIGLKERIQSNLDTTEIKKVLGILSPLDSYRISNSSTTVEPDWKDPFDMEYTKNVMDWLGKPIYRIPIEKAKELALKIKDAKSPWDDDEQSIEDIFKNILKDKTQVSDLSAVFYSDHKKDLWEYIRSFLNDDEMHRLVTIPVAKLPKYKIT